MTTWTREELDKVEQQRNWQSPRDGGRHRRKPVTMWVVRVGDELCVRSVNGRAAGWFRGVQVRREGRIRAGRVENEVIFTDADPGLNDAIDAAYRAKYRRYQAKIVDSIVSPEARSATIRLLPR